MKNFHFTPFLEQFLFHFIPKFQSSNKHNVSIQKFWYPNRKIVQTFVLPYEIPPPSSVATPLRMVPVGFNLLMHNVAKWQQINPLLTHTPVYLPQKRNLHKYGFKFLFFAGVLKFAYTFDICCEKKKKIQPVS